jgi:MinD superfamily P-loop ATPase
MKELVVISGKGGTGKTSIVGAFCHLASNKVIADCDVDAADLHLLVFPEIIESHPFKGGKTAYIDKERCILCGECLSLCRFKAISEEIEIASFLCEGCGLCVAACPENAITLRQETAGNWFISTTKYGPFVHAKLGIAQENSGLLVAQVRLAAKKIAEEQCRDLIITDGPPGIGCAVISSITGTDLALLITEPTLSGIHDMDRTLELTSYFHIKTLVCINKFDINTEMSDKIEKICAHKGTDMIGKIPYDSAVTQAQINGMSVIEYKDSEAASSIAKLWDVVNLYL